MTKKWSVRIPVYADFLVVVEAESMEEAIKKGEEMHVSSLCHSCSSRFEIGDAAMDGDITAEEME